MEGASVYYPARSSSFIRSLLHYGVIRHSTDGVGFLLPNLSSKLSKNMLRHAGAADKAEGASLRMTVADGEAITTAAEDMDLPLTELF